MWAEYKIELRWMSRVLRKVKEILKKFQNIPGNNTGSWWSNYSRIPCLTKRIVGKGQVAPYLRSRARASMRSRHRRTLSCVPPAGYTSSSNRVAPSFASDVHALDIILTGQVECALARVVPSQPRGRNHVALQYAQREIERLTCRVERVARRASAWR